MSKRFLGKYSTRASLLISLGFLSVSSSFLPVLSASLFNNTIISLNFPDTGSRGAPKKSAGGGTRSDAESCLTNEKNEPPLVVLMPNRENKAKTARDTPTFYGYVPTTTATQGEFVLVDSNDQEVYYTQFQLPSTPGIISLEIPKKVALKPGNYTWSFMVICDSRYRNRDKYVEGSLEYVEPNQGLTSQISNKLSLEKAQLYANSSLWFETLDTVIQIRQENPQAWQELLESVGLGMLADVPILDCCQVDN